MKKFIFLWVSVLFSFTTFGQSSENRIVEGSYFPNSYVQKNYIINGSCDKNVNNITASGSATLSASTSGKIKGAKSCAINASASTEKITWAAFTTLEQELYGRNCEARFTYTGDGSLYKAYVKQGSTQVTQDLTLTSTATISKPVSMIFPCGDLSTAPTVIIEATGDGAAIVVDDVYYGIATTLGDVKLDTEWAAVTVTSSITTNAVTTAKKRRVGDSSEYIITTTFSGVSASEGQLIYTLPETIDTTKINNTSSGTEALGTAAFYDNSGGSATGRLLGEVRYASSTTVTVAVIDDASGTAGYMDNVSGSGNYPVIIAASDKVISRFVVPVVGWTTNTVLRQDTSQWFVDANISGANPSLGVADVASYTELINASLTMTPRTNSAPVGIMCSTTNAAATPTTSASTCSAGSESIGANFTIPTTGVYEACFYGGHLINVDSGDVIAATFELIETPTNAQTLTLEGGTRLNVAHTGMTIATGTASTVTHNVSNCSLFNWSAGTKGIRLMYEQDITGTPNTSVVIGDADTATGQRDMRITIRPWLGNANAPLLVGSVVARDNTSDVTTINTSVAKSANYTATSQDETIVFTADSTLTLPAAASYKGKKYNVIVSGTGTEVIIDPNASETVCSQTTITLMGAKDSIEIQSDGSVWKALGNGCFTSRSVYMAYSAGTPTASRQYPDAWISSITDTATGRFSIVPKTGAWSDVPVCSGSSRNSAPNQKFVIDSGISYSATVHPFTVGNETAGDVDAYIVCFGPR